MWDAAYRFAVVGRVRDYAQVRADGIITSDVAKEALDLLQVDPLGLDEMWIAAC